MVRTFRHPAMTSFVASLAGGLAALPARRPRGVQCRCSAVASTSSPDKLKRRLLQLGALTDRGQLLFQQSAYAPLDKYNAQHRREIAEAVDALVATQGAVDPALMNGDWECVLSTKQLFRSSPFFMAIQDAFGDATFGEKRSSEVFFRLQSSRSSPGALPPSVASPSASTSTAASWNPTSTPSSSRSPSSPSSAGSSSSPRSAVASCPSPTASRSTPTPARWTSCSIAPAWS